MDLKYALDDAYEPLLNRRLADEAVSNHMTEYVDVLKDVVNYGTNLIPRCWQDSDRSLVDLVVLLNLTRQAVSLLDAAQLLLEKCCPYPAHLQLRALFEASVYVSWILKDDAERRATAYYVADLRRRRRACLRLVPGSKEQTAYVDSLGDLDSAFVTAPGDQQRQRGSEELNDIDRVLANERYADINSTFDERQKGKDYDVPWYQVGGEKGATLLKLACAIDRRAAYSVHYTTGSGVMHSKSTSPHVRTEPGKANVRPLRDPESYGYVFKGLVGEALNLYRVVLTKYRHGELQNLSRKYQRDWRPTFMAELSFTLGGPRDSVDL